MFWFYCNSFNILYYSVYIGIFKSIFQCGAHLIVTQLKNKQLKNKIIRAVVVLGFQGFSLPEVMQKPTLV